MAYKSRNSTTTAPVVAPNASLKDAQGNLPFGYGNTQQPVQPILPQQPQMPDIQGMINQMKQAQSQAIIGKLDSAKNNALSGIQGRRTAVEPTYQGYKNNASTQNYMQAKNFAEYMANRGTGTGTNAQAQLLKNMGFNSNMTKLDIEKDKVLQGLSQDEALINQNYNSDLVSAQAGIESQAMQQAIQSAQQAYQQAVEQQRYQQQLQQQQRQFEAAQQQQNLDNQFKQTQYENMLKQQQFENDMAMNQFEMAKAKASNTGGGGASPKPMTPQQQLDYQMKQLQYYNDLWKISGQVPTAITGNNRQGPESYVADEPIYESLIPGVAPGTPYNNASNTNYNTVLNRVMSMIGNDNYDATDIQNYILSSNISDDEAARLLNMVGN